MTMQTFKSVLLIGASLMVCASANAGKVELPQGMGGVPDIGAIPCEVFSEMLEIGPLGTRLSLLTWADGYFYATTGSTMDELVIAADKAGEIWDFTSLTDHFADFCAINPEAVTREAVRDLGAQLAAE